MVFECGIQISPILLKTVLDVSQDVACAKDVRGGVDDERDSISMAMGEREYFLPKLLAGGNCSSGLLAGCSCFRSTF